MPDPYLTKSPANPNLKKVYPVIPNDCQCFEMAMGAQALPVDVSLPDQAVATNDKNVAESTAIARAV